MNWTRPGCDKEQYFAKKQGETELRGSHPRNAWHGGDGGRRAEGMSSFREGTEPNTGPK